MRETSSYPRSTHSDLAISRSIDLLIDRSRTGGFIPAVAAMKRSREKRDSNAV
jgi:hypothetical protein